MAEEKFEINLLRFMATGTYVSVLMQVSRELFGKSYFVLSAAEKVAVDQTANATIGANYQSLTPHFLGGQPKNPIGFEAPPDAQKKESDKK